MHPGLVTTVLPLLLIACSSSVADVAPSVSPSEATSLSSPSVRSPDLRTSPRPTLSTSTIGRPSPAPPSDLLVEVNRDRTQAGLSRLTRDECLTQVAKLNAARMARNESGSAWNGSERDAACNLHDPQTGEIGAYWTGGIDAVAMNRLFMSNSQDRDTIAFPYYCCAGYAWVVGANGYGYASVEFG